MQTLNQALSKLTKERLYLAKAAVVAAVAGLALSFLLAGKYTSTTRLIPPQQVQSTLSGLMGQLGVLGFTGLAGLRNPSDVYVSLLRTDSIALALAKRFDLYEHYGVSKFDDVRRRLEKRSRIRAGRDGIVIVEVSDDDAEVAAKLANGYQEELYKLVHRLSAEETAQRKRFVETRMHEVKAALEAKEQDFRAMREKVGMLRIEGEAENTYATMGGLRAGIMIREVALRTMARSFSTAENPAYKRIEAEIAGLKSELEKLEQSPHVRNPKFVVAADKAPQLVMEYASKLRELKYEEAMYQAMQRQAELLRMEDTRDFLQFLIVDSARVAEKRDFPGRLAVVLITLFLGLALAIYLVATDRVWPPRRPGRSEPVAPGA
jgi:capsule polysaccharide export protein KpsE/RkpR